MHVLCVLRYVNYCNTAISPRGINKALYLSKNMIYENENNLQYLLKTNEHSFQPVVVIPVHKNMI